MNEFIPDKSQMDALKTWYDKSSPLHLNPRHPCIKLAGEAGEILDLYGKEEYKPNFSWWNCKRCKHNNDRHNGNLGCGDDCFCINYTPLILDELGDYSYYLRILAYQKQMTFEDLCISNKYISEVANEGTLEEWLNDLCLHSVKTHYYFLRDNQINREELEEACISFLATLHKLNTPLSQVLGLNYKKLNSEATNHGWKSAAIKTRS